MVAIFISYLKSQKSQVTENQKQLSCKKKNVSDLPLLTKWQENSRHDCPFETDDVIT